MPPRPFAALGHGRSWLSLGRAMTLGLVVMTTLVALALGTAVWAYARDVAAQNHLLKVIDPARLANEALLTDYINEETGVRGYILSRQAAFLEPYSTGVAGARRDRAQLGALEAKDPQSDRLLARVDAAARLWRTRFALPAIAATQRGQRTYTTSAALDRGRAEFDQLRATFTTLDGALQASAAASTATLHDSEDLFVVTVGIVASLLVLTAVGATTSLGTWVVRPLSALRAQVREVAAGERDRPIALSGPPELVELAQDVDTMRKQIVSELHSVAEASEQLSSVNVELQRSNQELEQFAYVASHDLQEPLRKVVSFCDLLEKRYGDQLDERAKEYIAYAVDGAKRMQGLINDLLAFSRVGRTTSAFVTVSLVKALEQALGNLEAQVSESSAKVTHGPLPAVSGDPSLLVALFQNLVGNSIKFNNSGAPTVHVTAQRDADVWRLAVTDNGIGVEPRFAERIFEIFQRLHGREAYSGTGIGLALCKKIVEFHGGHIWLDTEYSSGTRIFWTLPISGRR